MTNETFVKLVAEEVKNKLSPMQRAVLLQKENWGGWRDALVSLASNLESQIQQINADEKTDKERYAAFGSDGEKLMHESSHAYKSRASKINRFKFHVERRLDDVTKMIETDVVLESAGWDDVAFYRRAINEHRVLLREYDLEETPIDKALWAALDKKWEFDTVAMVFNDS